MLCVYCSKLKLEWARFRSPFILGLYRICADLPFFGGKVFEELVLLEFSAVEKNGKLINNASMEKWIEKKYYCGLFIFTKQKNQKIKEL